jgi:opacity protein-like surface antigen
MKKLLMAIAIIFLGISSAQAATLDIGPHAYFYLPPEGGGNTLMTGVHAIYRLNDYFSVKGSADTSNYSTPTNKYTDSELSLDLLAHLMGYSNIDPYLGAGFDVAQYTVDTTTRGRTGLNALAGLAVTISGLQAGLEVKYTIPDTQDMKTGYYSVGGQITGSIHMDL